MSTARRVGAVLAVLGALWIGHAAVAGAHPTLLFTEPGSDTAVAESPQQITLLFNEAVAAHAVTVLDEDARELPTTAPTTAQGGRFVSIKPDKPFPPGAYVARWRVTGSDGDPVEGEFRFAVGVALTAAGVRSGASGGASTAWSDAALRWLLFAGLATGFGGLVGRRFVASARAERPDLPGPRSLVTGGLALAFVGVAGLSAAAIIDADTVRVLWTGSAGRVLAVEAIALATGLVLTATSRDRLALAALLPVFVAEGIRAHPNTEVPGWGAIVTAVHLTAVAVWVGALVATVSAMTAWRRHHAAVRWVLSRYIATAAWTFAVVAGTGVVSALLVVPLSAVFTTTYGWVLVVKVALVGVAAALALAARLSRPLQRDPTRARTLMRAEIAALATVLVASAALVSTPPGGAAAPAPPPPPTGPQLALGSLAGQIGVSVTASTGQLVVRLSTPRRGDYYAPQPDQTFGLSAALTDGGELDLRGCGQGCFTAPARWRDGDNVLTLRVEAQGWQGATIAMPVPWPTEPGEDDLARAAAALRDAGEVTVYETVTSDTTSPRADPTRLDLSGEFFLRQEPYAAGTAPIARRIARPGQPVRLALGFPAATINVALTLDDSGRVVEETLTDAKHLVTRRLVYPEND